MFGTPCRTALPILAAIVVCLGLLGQAGAQEAPRPGLDTPKIRVAVADFASIGGDQAAARQLSDEVRKALAAHPQISVVSGEDVQKQVAAAEAGVLACVPEVSRKLGDAIAVDAVIFGRIVSDLSGILDDPAPLATPVAQVTVAETLSLDGELYPGLPVALGAGANAAASIASAAVALLPAAGRVLSIIDSPEGVLIQLFPLGGRVLAPGAQYGIYDPVAFRVPVEDPTGKSEALSRQELRTGILTGKVLTAREPNGHAIEAASVDPRGRISVGQLVGLPPLQGAEPAAPALPILLVNATPAESVVLVDGKPVGVTPLAVSLQAGRPQRVAVARRDHNPTEHEVTAAAADALAMSVALKEIPAFGSLKIATTPAGATVSMDGVELGKAPLERDQVPSGEHKLVLALPGYAPVARQIEVKRQRAAEVSVALEKDMRAVKFRTAPDGARVFVDGEEAGTTPLDLRAIQTGQHALKITLAGHAILNETFDVRPTDEEQVFSYRMRALAGNVRVETTPAGAAVSVDGEPRGKSPLALTGLPIGQHKLTLEADGYLPVNKTIEVQDQQTSVVQETLTKAEGQLICVSVPTGATIILDGEERGVTPKTITGIPVGKRELTLRLEGYQPWTAKAPIFHGETTKVEVALIRVGPALRRQP